MGIHTRSTLIIENKSRSTHKSAAVLYSQIAGDAYIEMTDILGDLWIIDKPQFNGPEDQVLIPGPDTSSESEIRFVVKDALFVICDHGHFAKCEGRETKAKYLPRRKCDCLTLDMESLRTPKAIGAKILQTELIIYIKWKRRSLTVDTGEVN